ncbi:MAG TPA: hypothetical protein VGE57_04250 [Solimonas sp.]
METLVDILGAARHREALIADMVALIEAQVAARGGLKGAGLRAMLGMAKAARPDLLPRAAARLLPEFAGALEPLYARYRDEQTVGDFGQFLQRQAPAATAALLAVADARAAEVKNAAARSAYSRLRGSAEDEVRGAIPAIGILLNRYLQ